MTTINNHIIINRLVINPVSFSLRNKVSFYSREVENDTLSDTSLRITEREEEQEKT
jgi:hypothetical protein